MRRRRELKVPVRVVFDNDDIELLAELVDFLPALEGEGSACWVLSDCYSVEDVRETTLLLGVPVLENIAETPGSCGEDAFGVHCDWDDADAVGRRGLDTVRVGELLNEEVVAS